MFQISALPRSTRLGVPLALKALELSTGRAHVWPRESVLARRLLFRLAYTNTARASTICGKLG
ncbi:hypothetical protein CGRA01v4_11268 [Colletotrichum graminicola]|nr:hypothetical protein CGRA01v4_11268 [Colletotrichum graminicola]